MSEGELKLEVVDEIARIEVLSSLYDQKACDRLSELVTSTLSDGHKTLSVDISRCEAISAYGVGKLIAASESAKQLSATLTVIGVRKEIFEMLKPLLVDQMLDLKGVLAA